MSRVGFSWQKRKTKLKVLDFHINTYAEQSDFKMKFKWNVFLLIFSSNLNFRNVKIITCYSGSLINGSIFLKIYLFIIIYWI